MKAFRLYAAPMAVTFALQLMLLVSTAEAGIPFSVFAAIYDQQEASNAERVFVPPVAGSEAPRPCVGAFCPLDEEPFSRPPELIYNSNTGNLSARISAAVLDVGRTPASTWADVYTLAQLSVDSRLLPVGAAARHTTAFVWDEHGTLETADFAPQTSDDYGRYVWQPMDWSTVAWPPEAIGIWPFAGKPVAAVVDFGSILPAGLTEADFARLGIDNTRSNYVDYFNHRGIVTLHVPLSIEIVPEPRSVIQVILAIGIVWCSRLRRS